ncbi:glycosyltransferase family 2 protein [Geotoga petraea]|uniref:Glycosyltransferase family 2 protein n=1 Tax=Geotoga petraea TaxID=28234 RepID=A0A4Z0VY73_9BACT|nr:glycosyltransferase family 2 protein [Geotoga petraea]TGG86979.1 glycosyltransferase family 2 protein [Geotoga petraea]
MKPFISACMIVKNEEVNLDRCLRSITNFVDEIIIVDTGSTDSTIEIAKKYTEKIYYFEWTGNFSEARNESLKYPNGEWVFIIDADEEATEKMQKDTRSFLKSVDSEVSQIMIPNINFLDIDLEKTEIASNGRFFRNGKVKYENIVHNQPVIEGEIEYADLPLNHYGYIWTRYKRKQKTIRTSNLLREYLKENPDNLYYLIQLFKTEKIGKNLKEYYRLGNKIEKIIIDIVNRKKIKYKPSPMENEFLHIWSSTLNNLNYLDRAEYLAKLGTRWNPDCFFVLGSIYEKKKKWESIYDLSNNFLKIINFYINNSQLITWSSTAIYRKDDFHIYKYNALIEMKKFKRINEASDLEIDIIKKHTKKNIMISKLKDSFVLSDNYREKENILTFLKKIEDIISSDENEIFDFVFNKINDDENYLGLILELANNDFSKDTILKMIKRIPKNFNGYIRNLLLADLSIMNGEIKNSVNNYKKVLKENIDFGKYIKQIIDDILIAGVNINIDPVTIDLYEEYSEKKSLLFDLSKYFNDFEISLFDYYLGNKFLFFKISNLNIIFNNNKEIFLNMIERNSMIEIFDNSKKGFILYKMYEASKEIKNYELAKNYLWESFKVNPKLGDIKEGVNEYIWEYPEEFNSFYNEKDEIYDVLNLSKFYHCSNHLNPLRTLRESSILYYVEKIPSESIRKDLYYYYKENTNIIENYNLIDEETKYSIIKNFDSFDYFSIKRIDSFSDNNFIDINNLRLDTNNTENAVILNPEFIEFEDINKIIYGYKNIIILFNLSDEYKCSPFAKYFWDLMKFKEFKKYLAENNNFILTDEYIHQKIILRINKNNR